MAAPLGLHEQTANLPDRAPTARLGGGDEEPAQSLGEMHWPADGEPGSSADEGAYDTTLYRKVDARKRSDRDVAADGPLETAAFFAALILAGGAALGTNERVSEGDCRPILDFQPW